MTMMIRANSDIKLLRKNNSSGLISYSYTIIKSIIFVGLTATLLFGIFQSIRRNSFNGFIDGMVFGASLALIVVPLIVLLDLSQKLKCYLKYNFIDFRVNQERRFIIEDDYSSVLNKLYSILSNHKKIDVYNKDIENGIIEATTKRSWRSFGEDIKINLFKGSEGKVVVIVSSKPRTSLTMIDYSKNFENIETIMKDITNNFKIIAV